MAYILLTACLLATVDAASVSMKTVFGTGHLLDLGGCAAIASRVGKQCFEDMPSRIAPHLSPSLEANVTCETHIVRSPCLYGTMKHTVRTEGYDCDAIALLLADATEACLRNKADARFWALLAYYFAIVVAGTVLLAMLQMCLRACGPDERFRY